MREIQVQSLGQEDLPEKGMATHSSILAWRIPRTEEPGGLQQSMESQSQTQLSNFHFHNIPTAWYSKQFTYLDSFSPYSIIMLYYYYVLIFCPF